jgi:hypothetical protein
MDPINRVVCQIVAEFRPFEMDTCLMQLSDFIPPENRNWYDPREIRKQVAAYLRKVMLHSNITINLLHFQIVVQFVLGKSIEIYIKRIGVTGPEYEANELESIYKSEKL